MCLFLFTNKHMYDGDLPGMKLKDSRVSDLVEGDREGGMGRGSFG